MRKKFLLALAMSLLFVTPVYGQADNNTNPIEDTLLNRFNERLYYVTDTTIKYTTAHVNIRKYPSTDAEILDVSLVNTEFEVVLELDGWAMITTQDGYAFMKNDWFSDEPVTYDENELNILAHVLAGECQSLPDEEQRYVGSVVLNRVNSDKFPDTIEDVVYQKGQYACVTDGNYFREPTERNWANAQWLLENGSVLPAHVVYQSVGRLGKLYLKTEYHSYCY